MSEPITRKCHIQKLKSLLRSLNWLMNDVFDTPNTYHEFKKLEEIKKSITFKLEDLQLIEECESFKMDLVQ